MAKSAQMIESSLITPPLCRNIHSGLILISATKTGLWMPISRVSQGYVITRLEIWHFPLTMVPTPPANGSRMPGHLRTRTPDCRWLWKLTGQRFQKILEARSEERRVGEEV